MAIRALIGLGNPGRDYEETRHNAGFLVLDRLAERLPLLEGIAPDQQHFRTISRLDCELLRTRLAYLVKPTTFMNLSGVAVQQICHFYKLAPTEILVIYDDMDLPLGRIRLRTHGSSGGHNGIKSIIQHLKTDQFPRLKVGIGRRAEDRREVISHVLSPFAEDERILARETLNLAADAVVYVLNEGLEKAMTEFNGRVIESPPQP